MHERIRSIAQQLGIGGGGLAKLARDIAHDDTLRDLEYMNREDAERLMNFLELALQYENKPVCV